MSPSDGYWGVNPQYWSVNPQDSPLTPAFSPSTTSSNIRSPTLDTESYFDPYDTPRIYDDSSFSNDKSSLSLKVGTAYDTRPPLYIPKRVSL
jgi:hypothetical protein